MKRIVAERLGNSEAQSLAQCFTLLLGEVREATTGLIAQRNGEGSLVRTTATTVGRAMDTRIARADDHEKVILFASSVVAKVPLSGLSIERCELAARNSSALRILFWAAYRRLPNRG